jgi:hypothetical protein
MICVSESGNARSVSIVFDLFSSDRLLIVKAGIKIINIHGRISKNGLKDADPTANMSLVYIKLLKTANRTITMYPIGFFR